MSDRPEDDDVDLGITVPTVVSIIDAARAVDEMEEDESNEDLQDEENPEDNDPDALAEALEEQINVLNEDEQAALIALAWVGRGDYDAEDWEEAVRLARERNEAGGAATYLMGMEMLGDLLSEGLEAFGISAEEIAR
ncbi:DUF3775 domain-containing protein [Roseomonas sp. OT10]|uniref:DUF3775 domain-containing protein n=1 Tax=Roseomonas cutis TaxID=2897332 RepID=UPI001E4176FA|nr:DUF3775 domain-containing protein [Roseomonas sp. OT10]UFN47616.1 DUF3775 domain-containing protein [Roseomonas sp. OT10]